MSDIFSETRNPGRRAEDKKSRKPCAEHYWDLHDNHVNIYIIPSGADAETVRELVGSASSANDCGKA